MSIRNVRTAVGHTKGGVGKSSSVVSLAATAVIAGKKTLVVDFDPQGTASMVSGVFDRRDINSDDYGSHRIIMEEILPSKLILKTDHGYDIIPASAMLYSIDPFIKSKAMGDTILARMFNIDDALNEYDLIICDTQGAPSSLLTSVINMTSDVFVSNIAAKDSTKALDTLLGIIAEINNFRSSYPGLDPVVMRGHFFNLAEVGTQIHALQDKEMLEKLGPLHLIDYPIVRATDVKKAVQVSIPLPLIDPDHKITKQYEALFGQLFKEFA